MGTYLRKVEWQGLAATQLPNTRGSMKFGV
jgi:hypothetical protein